MNTATLFKRCQALCTVQDGGKTQTKGGGINRHKYAAAKLWWLHSGTIAHWRRIFDDFSRFAAQPPSCISMIRGLIAPIRWIVPRHTADALHSSPAIWTHPDVAKKLLKLEPSLSLWTFMSDLTERKWSQKLNSNKIIFQGFCWQTGKWAGYCCVL